MNHPSQTCINKAQTSRLRNNMNMPFRGILLGRRPADRRPAGRRPAQSKLVEFSDIIQTIASKPPTYESTPVVLQPLNPSKAYACLNLAQVSGTGTCYITASFVDRLSQSCDAFLTAQFKCRTATSSSSMLAGSAPRHLSRNESISSIIGTIQ